MSAHFPRLATLLVLSGAGGCGADPQQHEITAPGELLTDDGRLREPGWSPRQLLHWNGARVHDPSQLRQWDFFSILSDDSAVNLTLLDLGFLQVATVSVVDLATAEMIQTMQIGGAYDTLRFSEAVEGSASLSATDTSATYLAFTTDGDSTEIEIDIPESLFGDAARGTLIIHRRPEMPYLSVATPFDEDPHLFFYEQKLQGMSAEGSLTIGVRTFTFAADATSAVMDWGRGAWPKTATWRWAGASGVVAGVPVALNLGEGFGNARAGSENLVVYGDVAHKLATVAWSYDPDHPTEDWRFEAPDGRLSLVLHPVAPEVGGIELGTLFSRLHKAYGTMSGTIVLDDGRTIEITGLRGFAEQMDLSW